MNSEWSTVRVEDIAEKIAMGPFGSSIKVETFVASGLPIISGQHLRGTALNDNGFNFITKEHGAKLKNANVFRGDVIFTHAGNIGQVSYIPETSQYDRYVISQRQFYLRCNTDKILPQFVVYYFQSHEGQHKLLANATQVGVPSIARPSSYLRTIEIPLPPLRQQRIIVSVLETLEHKIEHNRQINQTLEQMAQALFQAWFVDFEPVKAKVAALADGRDPLRAAMSTLSGKTDAELDELPSAAFDTLAATAALFPKEIEESGEIPRGWEAATLGKYVTPSGVSVTAEDLKGDEAYFGLEHLPRNSIALDAWGQTAGLESGKRRFSQGTILFGKLRPYFHKVGVAPLDGVCSTDILALQPRTPPWFGYALVHLSSDALIAFAERLSNGAKMPRVGWKDLENYPVVAPGEQLAAKFNEHVKSSVDAIRENIFEARTLATLRDSLLPKLLSGELAVTPEEQGPERRGIEKGVREGRGIERTWD